MASKFCSVCKQWKVVDEFYDSKQNKDGKCSGCKECRKAYSRLHRARNRERMIKYYYENRVARLLYGKEWRQTLKQDVLTHYGNGKPSCVSCGFSDIRALSIDHIKGGGNKHKRDLNKASLAFYRWLKNQSYPEGYQTLCMNCQFIKRIENKEDSIVTKTP